VPECLHQQQQQQPNPTAKSEAAKQKSATGNGNGPRSRSTCSCSCCSFSRRLAAYRMHTYRALFAPQPPFDPFNVLTVQTRPHLQPPAFAAASLTAGVQTLRRRRRIGNTPSLASFNVKYPASQLLHGRLTQNNKEAIVLHYTSTSNTSPLLEHASPCGANAMTSIRPYKNRRVPLLSNKHPHLDTDRYVVGLLQDTQARRSRSTMNHGLSNC